MEQVYKNAIEKYLSEIIKIYSKGNATEHSYRKSLEELIEDLYVDLDAINEPKREKSDAPDYIVAMSDITVGYIEAKNIGKNLASKEYDEQFKRYKSALDNLIITDYVCFNLYRNGELTLSVRIAKIESSKIVPISSAFESLERLLDAFRSYKGSPIASSSKLAKIMAGKAELLADVIFKTLKNVNETDDNKSLRSLLETFRKILIKDISEKEFSDVYAQTITYGMFSGYLYDNSDNYTLREAAINIPKSNPLLRNLFGSIASEYNVSDSIKWIVDDLASIFNHVNKEEILKGFGKNTEIHDPVIHFYETFLSEYNPGLRKLRGVWYTPKPVVNFIVRAINDILKNDFNLNNGLASADKIKIETNDSKKGSGKEIHKVQILDPATGTGTFLAEVIRQIHIENKNELGCWNSYVDDHLLKRVYGFEIMMASYAVAHLKLNMILRETGYSSNTVGDRLRVYLTNSLEEAHADTESLPLSWPWLSEEAREADIVKKETPVMIILGNPPYSGESQNKKSKWIMDLMEVYKKEPSGGKLKEKNPKMINDDYVKFIRYAEQFIEKNKSGIVGYINNHGFLDNSTFRGMRYHLLNTFDKIYIIDLHGNVRKKEVSPDGSKDENVFNIMQGVSINIFVKTGKKRQGKLAEVYCADLYGKREDKYKTLLDNNIKTIGFKKIDYQKPYYFFVPKDFTALNDYNKGFAVNELFKVNSVGIVTARDSLAIQYTKKEMQDVLDDFANLDVEQARSKYNLGKDTRDWTVAGAQRDLKTSGLDKNKIQAISYRPFDTRYTYYTGNSKGFQCMARAQIMQHFINRDRITTMQHFINRDNLGLLLEKIVGNKNDAYKDVFITDKIHDCNITSSSCYIFPLYLYSQRQDEYLNLGEALRSPNFKPEMINKIANGLKLKFVSEKSNSKNTFSPLDMLDYIYAVLYNSRYRNKYKEFLRIDFPKYRIQKILRTSGN